MKRISVTPRKEVEGVRFGETRASVRRAYGQYKEVAGKIACDDFKWCKVFYDANGKMDSVEINTKECNVVIGSTTVNTSNMAACRKSLNITSGSSDQSRGIAISDMGSKIVLTFTRNGNNIVFKGNKKEENEEPKMESADSERLKQLTDMIGPEEAKKQMEAEKKQRDQNDAAMKASSDKVKDAVRGAIGDEEKATLKKEDGDSLLQFYDDLKNRLNSDPAGAGSAPGPMRVAGGVMTNMQHPGTIAYKQAVSAECDKLRNGCCKHLLLDIYCRVLPLDQSFVAGNMGQMSGDVDAMLAAKGVTPSQYLTSCSEATKAPLLEFVLRSIDNMAKEYLEAANEKLKDAQEQDINVDPPEAPDPDAEPESEDDVASQLVDVKKDTEYENFIDKLKEKTIKKIVADVSKIITDKKEEKEMAFDPQPIASAEAQTESTVSIGLQYLQSRVYTENGTNDTNLTEEMLGLAIREATLNEIDTCFSQPGTSFQEFANRVRLGKGYVLTESAVNFLTEAAKH